MKVRIGSTWLAPGGFAATQGIRVNGQQITQEVEFFRAVARQFYARKNRASVVSFSVTRTHSSLREAEAFILTHYASLPDSGDVYFYCGTDSDQQIVTLPGAVLDAAEDGAILGTSSRFTYNIRGGLPVTDITPGPDPDMSNIRRSEVALTMGATSVAVTFGTPMPGTPVIAANISAPDGGDSIFPTLQQSTISSSGFTALFAPISGSGYFLSYIAIS